MNQDLRSLSILIHLGTPTRRLIGLSSVLLTYRYSISRSSERRASPWPHGVIPAPANPCVPANPAGREGVKKLRLPTTKRKWVPAADHPWRQAARRARSRKQRERQRPCGRRGGHGAGVAHSEVRKTGDAICSTELGIVAPRRC